MFFFSSRRRHTRWPRDWSSDVCSSDLGVIAGALAVVTRSLPDINVWRDFALTPAVWIATLATGIIITMLAGRSEERRVGKESEEGGGRDDKKNEGRRARRSDVSAARKI